MDARSIERALAAVGELLTADDEGYAIVVTGGATDLVEQAVEHAKRHR